jgi:putative sterol carrier protein
MDTKRIIEEIVPKMLTEDNSLIEKINATYTFKIEGMGNWFVDLTKPGGAVEKSDKESNCNIETDDESFVQMAMGTLNTQMAFLAGKFRTNNPQLAVRLNALIEAMVQYIAKNNLT